MINGINIENFKKYEFMHISNIFEGLENHNHICFTGSFENCEIFIKKLIEDNELVFFDFYFSNLNDEEKQVFNKMYNCDNILKRFNFNIDEVYFNMDNIDEEILRFILKISYEEILFSTFYFKNPSMLLWTNYNKEFILFFKENFNILKYENSIKKLNLKILFEKK